MEVDHASVKYLVLKQFQAEKTVKIMSHISNKAFVYLSCLYSSNRQTQIP